MGTLLDNVDVLSKNMRFGIFHPCLECALEQYPDLVLSIDKRLTENNAMLLQIVLQTFSIPDIVKMRILHPAICRLGYPESESSIRFGRLVMDTFVGPAIFLNESVCHFPSGFLMSPFSRV